jgi:TPR repeat protein
MRSGSLLLAIMMMAGTARAAKWSGCPPGDYARSQAECITEQMSPDVIDKLYRLALSTVDGKLDPDHVPSDFLYIAEEAGEAARLKGPNPLIEMANSSDVSKLTFAAPAIARFVEAVHDGYSHRARFDLKGDAKLYADAQRILREPCKRLAARENRFIRTEGERCLRELDPPVLPPSSYGSADVAEAIQGLTRGAGQPGRGGLRATDDTLGLATPGGAAAYRDRCDKGDGKGCYLLAELNRFGRFGPGRTYPQNLPRAVELYQRGCDLGFDVSCSELAGMLRAGKGIPRDAARAAALDRRSCKLNHKASCAKHAP